MKTLNTVVSNVNTLNTNTEVENMETILTKDLPIWDTVIKAPTKEEKSLAQEAMLTKAMADLTAAYAVQERDTLVSNIQKANGAVQAVRMLRALQSTQGEHEMGTLLTRALLSYVKAWDFSVDTGRDGFVMTAVTKADAAAYHEGRKSYADYYMETVLHAHENASGTFKAAFAAMAKDLAIALNLNNTTRIMSDKDVEATFKNKVNRARVLGKKFLPELPMVTPVNLVVTTRGVRMVAKPGETFGYVGEVLATKTTRNHDYLLTIDEVNKGLFTVADRICFHIEYEDSRTGKTILSSKPTRPMGSKLNTVFLMKASNLDYSVLLEKGKEGYRKIVSVKQSNGRLTAVENPLGNSSISFAYSEVGLASSTDSLAGYIAPLTNIEGLVVTTKNANGDLAVVSQEGINKAMARNKAQNNTNKGWNMGRITVNVVFSTKEYMTAQSDFSIIKTAMDDTTKAKAVHDFGPSPLLLTKEEFLRAGHARVVSEMHQGGLKAVTNWSALAPEGKNFTGPNAFKGGILAAALLCWNKHREEKLDMASLVGRDDLVKTVIAHAVAHLEMTEFNGYMVQTLEVELEYRVTTPYTIDAFKLKGEDLWGMEEQINLQADMETVIDSANQKVSSLRSILFTQIMADRNFKGVEALYQGVTEGRYVAKDLGTRITATAWDAMTLWHDRDASEALMDELIANLQDNFSAKKVKRTAMRIANGKAKNSVNVIARVDAKAIAEVLRNRCPKALAETINTYPTEVLREVNALLGNPMACRSAKFVEINFDGIKVYFPALSALFYVEQECKAPGKFIATGMLKDLLTAVKGFILSDKTASIHSPSIKGQGLKLRARLQTQLLGKNLGYLDCAGTYLAATNFIGMYDMPVDAIYTTNEALLSDEMLNPVTEVLRAKYPLYHDRTLASVDLVETTLGDTLVDFAMCKAAFVHHVQMFSKGDDFDGDLLQVMAPSLETVQKFKRFDAYQNIAGVFFHNSAVKEGETSIKTELNFHTYTMEDVKKAISASAMASRNIGTFTTLKNRVEAMLMGVEVFTSVEGTDLVMTEQRRIEINQFMALLCQTESMDNMKQNSNGQAIRFIMDLLAIHNINRIKGKNGSTDTEAVEEARITYAKEVANRVLEVRRELGVNVESDFATFFVDAIFYAANLAALHGTRNLDFFRNSVVDTGFHSEIADILSDKSATICIDTVFEKDMFGKAVNLDKAADAASMTARLLNKLSKV